MSKVTNKYGVDTTVRIRRDGKVSVKLDFWPSPEALKKFAATSLATLLADSVCNGSEKPGNEGVAGQR
jgi:hypothetical protein